jgi:hypothetical protein
MLSVLSEIPMLASAGAAIWATHSLAVERFAGNAITESTTVSIGLLLVAGVALFGCAWRAGRKSANGEAQIKSINEKLLALHQADEAMRCLVERHIKETRSGG